MAQFLINFIINVITSLSSLILAPFINALYSLFPDLTNNLHYFTDFLSMAFQYMGSIMKLCLIDNSIIAVVFTFLFIRISIYVLLSSIRFILKAYNYLKP